VPGLTAAWLADALLTHMRRAASVLQCPSLSAILLQILDFAGRWETQECPLTAETGFESP